MSRDAHGHATPCFRALFSEVHAYTGDSHVAMPPSSAQISPPRYTRALSSVFHGESEARNKVVCEDAGRCFSCGAEGEPGHLRGVVTTSLPFFH